jgi:membrane-associated protease RseP (regulator of RpoE activity)
MKLKEVMRTEVADRKKAGFGLPLQMFAGLMVIALAFLALLYFFAPGQGQTTTISDYAGPNFGVVVSPDLTIVGVDPGGIAETSGVKAEDKLAKVDGQPVTTLEEVRDKMLDDLYNQKEITLTILRNNQPVDIKLKSATSKGHSGGPTPTPLPQGYAYF